MRPPGGGADGAVPTEGEPAVVSLRDASIRLGQFLQLAGLVDTGADAKELLRSGQVEVDDEVETRRGRRLRGGEVVRVGAEAARVGAHAVTGAPRELAIRQCPPRPPPDGCCGVGPWPTRRRCDG